MSFVSIILSKVYPYFKLKDPTAFKNLWIDAYAATKAAAPAEKSRQYSFSFEDNSMGACREAYGDADGVLLHLENVGATFTAVLDGPAELERIEVHGPAAERAKIEQALGTSPGYVFYTTEPEWGFRNAV